VKIEREVQLEEGLQWEEIGTEKKWNKKVETKSKHRDMRRQQERGGKKSKKRRNRKTTLRMRNSRSSCASCILVSTSVCVFLCVCVCIWVFVWLSVSMCAGVLSAESTQQLRFRLLFSQASLADSANRAKICIFVSGRLYVCIFYFWSEHKTRKCNQNVYMYMYNSC